MARPERSRRVTITDNGTPIPGVANGMDFVASNGTVVIPVDVSKLADGTLTISVMLTNGAGDSTATTTRPSRTRSRRPERHRHASPYINSANVWNFLISLSGDSGDSVTYAVSDGTTTLTGSRNGIPGSGKWSFAPAVNSLKDGPLTVTVTETETSGNQSIYTTTITKDTVAPVTPTVTLNPLDDSGTSSTDYVTNVTAPRISVAAEAGATIALYVNGALYTGQTLSPGNYTVTATATDAAGNTSATGTAPKTLVIDTSSADRQLHVLRRRDGKRPGRGEDADRDPDALPERLARNGHDGVLDRRRHLQHTGGVRLDGVGHAPVVGRGDLHGLGPGHRRGGEHARPARRYA